MHWRILRRVESFKGLVKEGRNVVGAEGREMK